MTTHSHCAWTNEGGHVTLTVDARQKTIMQPLALPTFTVLTPTHKGRDRLHILYDSLCRQTFKSFEWLIVQDGYDHRTQEVIDCICDSKPFFLIKSISISHNHKKAAINAGLSHANGTLLLIADDDDILLDKSMEILYDSWCDIEDKDYFVGVTGLCNDKNGTIIGDIFPKSIFDSNALDCSVKLGISGEKWGFQRVDIMRKYPFFDDAEGYVGESTIWFEIAKRYKTRYINKVVRTYLIRDNSIMTSPITREKILKNCQAYVYGYRRCACLLGKYAIHNPRYYIALSTNYVRYLCHCIFFRKLKPWMLPVTLGERFVTLIGILGVFFFLHDLLFLS